MNADSRSESLKALGASSGVLRELLAYTENPFKPVELDPRTDFPLPDELFVETWREYACEAKQEGVFKVLQKRLVQMRFPVREGISATGDYTRATRAGEIDWEAPPSGGIALARPEELELHLHPTPAGHVPVLMTRVREDFETLARCFLFRGEPKSIPPSMGATMIAGYNNWDRIRRLRAVWESTRQDSWFDEFARIKADVSLYQDRFIILSDGPYSGIPAVDLGLTESEWRRKSLVIRREHEATHYFTRRVFGSMRNNLLDEILADAMGIIGCEGRYRMDWFLRFVGLENYPDYREGGRLQNYRGVPPLSDGAFVLLQKLVFEAARHLHAASACLPASGFGIPEQAALLLSLSKLDLVKMALPERINGAFASCRESLARPG
jgi:hypothetical protein